MRGVQDANMAELRVILTYASCSSQFVSTHMHTHTSDSYRMLAQLQKGIKAYNSGYLLVITHLTTNPPVRCLNRAERTRRTRRLVVTCSATTKTADMSVYGIAQLVTRLCGKENDLINAHKL
jgi:hypothetical protein